MMEHVITAFLLVFLLLLRVDPRVEAFAVPPSSSALSARSGATVVVVREAVDHYDLLPPEEAAAPSDVDVNDEAVDDALAKENETKASELKRELLRLAASYDRGFAATPRAFDEANDVIKRLAEVNPTTNAAKGIDGDGDGYGEEVPLKAIWRMVWTSAYDVVTLGASPFAAPSAIYQDIRNPPTAINIIDFIPRAQTLFPPSIAPPSLLRAEVTTTASSRAGRSERVGLTFDAVKLRPIELLGQKVDNLPPLSVDLTWQRDLVEKLVEIVPGLDSSHLGISQNADPDAPGYFDVEYLDDELLVIRQQAPGGVFALVRVDSCDP